MQNQTKPTKSKLKVLHIMKPLQSNGTQAFKYLGYGPYLPQSHFKDENQIETRWWGQKN